MPRPNSRVRVWAGGTLAWVLGMVAARPLVGGDPLLIFAQEFIEAAPGPVATWAIETFGGYAQTLVVVGLAVALVVVGAAVGVLLARSRLRRRQQVRVTYGLALAVVVTTAGGFYVAAGGVSPRWLLASVLAIVPPGTVWWATASTGAPIGRRRALRRMGGAAGTVAGGAVLARLLGGPTSREGIQPGTEFGPLEEKRDEGTTTPTPTPTDAGGGEILETRRETSGVVVSSTSNDEPPGFDFEGMPARVGSAKDHYVVDKNLSAPNISTERWSLTVEGSVERERDFSFADLREHPDARETAVTMVCISNTVGGHLVGTTDWIAIPVRTLLEEAGVTDDAVDIVTRAADGYSEAIPWEVLRGREDIRIAIGMDGQTLPDQHGFPARLLIPGRYGMKSTKWVTGIEVSDSDHEAYWEQRGWVEEAVINTLSYVRAIQRQGDRIVIGGIAYAGTRGIDRVEVSVDGGETWADATLEDPVSALTRRRWRYVLERPDSGPLDVVVRATDGEGNRQTSERTGPHPGGSTGWHSISVSL